MKKMFTENWPLKLLSVGLATIIWLLVANTNDPVVTKRFSDIPVEVINQSVLESAGYSYEVLDGKDVSISVKGKSSLLNSMTESNFKAVADLSKLSVVDAVPIDVTALRYESQLEITITSNNTMRIKMDEFSSTNVQVNVDVKGNVAKGYAVGKKTSTPNMIKVNGPKNVINKIKEIRAEVSIDGASRNISTTTIPKLYDEEGKVIDNDQITMDSSSINVVIDLWKTKDVDLKVGYSGKPAKGYEVTQFDYEPKQIEIAASEPFYDEIQEIAIEDIDVSGMKKTYEETIDLTTDALNKKVLLTDSSSSVKIKVTIEKFVQKTFTFDKSLLKIENQGNKMISFDGDGSYSFTAKGTDEVLKGLEAKDFEPWINLEGMTAGEHNMNLHLKDIPDVEIVSKPDIDVTIEE